MRASMLAAAAIIFAVPAFAQEDGAALYEQNCASCHGPDRAGMGDAFPSLVGVGERLEPEEIATILEEGRGLMPSFSYLSQEEREALVAFVSQD